MWRAEIQVDLGAVRTNVTRLREGLRPRARGLARGGATPTEWPLLCEAAAKAQDDGDVEVVGVWSHLVYADEPEHETTDRQLAAFLDGLAVAQRLGITPRLRHLANSAATLTR